MKISELQSTIIKNTHLNGDLQLDNSLLREIEGLLSAIPSDSILIKTKDLQLGSNFITITGTTSILNMEEVSVEVIFYADTDPVNISLKIKPDPSWKFADSFPTLPPSLKIVLDKNGGETVSYDDSLLNQLTFRNAVFILRNFQSDKEPHIKPGLNFSAYPTNLTDFTIPLDQLLIGRSPQVGGLISPIQDGMPKFEFWLVDEKQSLSIGEFAIQNVRHRIRRADPPISEYPDTRLEVVGDFEIGKTKPISIEVFTPIYKNHSKFYFYGYPLNRSASLENGLDALAESVGLEPGKISLPKEFGVITKAYLDRFFCVLDYQEKQIERFFFSVDLPVQWEILPGRLVLSDIISGIMVIFDKNTPPSKEIIYSVTGVFALELQPPVHLEVTVLIGPELKIIGQLRDQETLPVQQAITALTGHSIDLPADLMVTRLYIDGTPQTKSFDFQFGISGDFRLFPDIDLSFQQLSLSVYHEGGTTPQTTGELSGKLHLADIDLYAKAAFSGGAAGWEFSAYTGKDQELSVSKLIDEFAATFSNFTLPESFDSISLKNLSASISTKSKQMSFSGEVDNFQLGQDTINVAVAISNKAWSVSSGKKDGGAGIHIVKLLENLLDDIGENQTQSLPATLESLSIDSFSFSYDGETKDFRFEGESSMDIDGKPLNIKLVIDISKEANQLKNEFSGTVQFGDNHFDLLFDKQQRKDQPASVLAASYYSAVGKTFDLSDFLQKHGPAELTNALPNDFDLSLTLNDLLFAQWTPANAPTKKAVLFSMGLTTDLNISKLPLVGQKLGADPSFGGAKLQVTAASADVSEAIIESINALMPEGTAALLAPPPPDGDLTAGEKVIFKKGLNFAAQLGSGPDNHLLSLDGGASQPPPQASAAVGQSTDGVKWYKLNKTFGPVFFDRLGVKYEKEEKTILFLLDGSLGAAGLSLSLMGLGVSLTLPISSPDDVKGASLGDKIKGRLSEIRVAFQLHGLGLNLQKGPLELGGAFLRNTYLLNGEPFDEYDGILTLSLEKFSMTAIGSYAEVNHHTSLFAYAVLNYPLGGPSFFFVTGLAAGFGYNRTLHLPPVEQVRGFPMVAAAVAASNGGATKPPGKGEQRDYLMSIISSMHDAIPPQVGEYFIGVGVHFTSFKLIDSFVLLAVSFGNKLEIDLLGTSKIVMPAPKEGEEDVPAIAVAELALKGTFIPEDGFMGIKMVLTSNSYVFDPNCHLTGGFAFYTWFKGDAGKDIPAGDFVLTIGGYHPKFNVPKHYPSVPRLGFNWQVTDEFHMEGGIYFALTARALMAGGHLSVVYQSDHIKAWFDAGADFLISWQPYHYDISLSVHIGVDATLGLLHISMDLGADVHVWGPEFSGEAHISLVVITIPVTFGSGKEDIPPISWDEFKKAFLPAPKGAAVDGDQGDEAAIDVLSVNVTAGLIKKVEVGESEDQVTWYVINPKELEIEIQSMVPLTSAAGETASFGLAPMAIKEVVSSILDFSRTPAEAAFKKVAIKKAVPSAIWGFEIKPKTNDPLFLKDALVGVRLSPVGPPSETNRHSLDKNNFKFEPILWKDAISFEALSNAMSDDAAILQQHLADETVRQKRNGILEALGIDASPETIQIASELAGAFIEPPKMVKFKKA